MNPHEAKLLLAIAGLPTKMWELPKSQLPPSALGGKIATVLYQVYKDHVEVIEALNRYLTDPRAQPSTLLPLHWHPRHGASRCSARLSNPSIRLAHPTGSAKRNSTTSPASQAENDSVLPGEAGE